MKYTLLFSICFSTVLSAFAVSREWAFGDGTVFRLNIPAQVICDQVSPPSDTINQAFTLSYPDDGNVSTISYQFFVTKANASNDWSTLEKIDAFLMKAGQRGLRGSVEKELVPIHLNMRQGLGGYLLFTDAELVGQTITEPGTFRHMTMVACEVEGYMIFVRGYTNSKTDSYFTGMNQIIESAEIAAK